MTWLPSCVISKQAWKTVRMACGRTSQILLFPLVSRPSPCRSVVYSVMKVERSEAVKWGWQPLAPAWRAHPSPCAALCPLCTAALQAACDWPRKHWPLSAVLDSRRAWPLRSQGDPSRCGHLPAVQPSAVSTDRPGRRDVPESSVLSACAYGK